MSIAISLPEDKSQLTAWPVDLSEQEKQSFDYAHVKKILERVDLTPSTLANVPSNTPVLERLDAAYRQAIYHYSNMYDLAAGKDLKILNHLLENRLWNYVSYGSGGLGLGGMLSLKIKLLPFGAIVAICVLGMSLLYAHQQINANIQREASVHRRSALIQIAALEAQRLTEMKNCIEQRSLTLTHQIKALEQSGEKDLKLCKELEALTALYKASFPNFTLTHRAG